MKWLKILQAVSITGSSLGLFNWLIQTTNQIDSILIILSALFVFQVVIEKHVKKNENARPPTPHNTHPNSFFSKIINPF